MNLSLKKILNSLFFNSSLLLMLVIGIQNSDNKTKINFFINESVELPVSFILGISFISGSIVGGFVSINGISKKYNLE
mgnify:CR=1 FL=1